LARLHGIVDLFAGISGVSTGFRDSGHFKPSLLIDIDKGAEETFVLNNPRLRSRFLCQDIAKVTATDIVERAGSPAGIVGCPPCQGLSDVGTRRHVDARNHLVDHYFRLVWSIRPKFFVMENVPRVLSYARFRYQLKRVGKDYNIWSGVLNAAQYGVPQTRQRAIVIGYRKDLDVDPTPPAETHCGSRRVFAYDLQKMVSPSESSHARSILGVYARLRPGAYVDQEKLSLAKPFVTCGDALSDLPRGATGKQKLKYRSAPRTPYQKLMRQRATGVTNHTRWNHGDELLATMVQLKPGEGPLTKIERKNYPYFSQAYSRLHRSGLARTVTTNFHNAGAGRFWHYREQRTLTIREAARLQSFRDSFEFPEDLPQTTQERLIGNAFPPLLARAIAGHIHLEIGHLL
jgi:DNA (cytosine-5)-methyltransferase 1